MLISKIKPLRGRLFPNLKIWAFLYIAKDLTSTSQCSWEKLTSVHKPANMRIFKQYWGMSDFEILKNNLRFNLKSPLFCAHYNKLHFSRHYLPTQWKFALAKVLCPTHIWTALAKVTEIATFTDAGKTALAKAMEPTLAPTKNSPKIEGKFCQRVFF